MNNNSDVVSEINLSHYRPTPDQRRFSISTFAVTGQITWEAKPAGEFAARVDVIKGAFAKMIPFTTMEASVKMIASADAAPGEGTRKVFQLKTIGAKPGARTGDGVREKSWTNLSVISPIEIPWVAEYALQRWTVGGPKESRFSFEDNQQVREAVISFRDDEDASPGDAMAILRVLKPGEAPRSLLASSAGASASAKKTAKGQAEPRPGDVLVTFRSGKIAGFTIFVPLIGKLQFVATDA